MGHPQIEIAKRLGPEPARKRMRDPAGPEKESDQNRTGESNEGITASNLAPLTSVRSGGILSSGGPKPG